VSWLCGLATFHRAESLQVGALRDILNIATPLCVNLATFDRHCNTGRAMPRLPEQIEADFTSLEMDIVGKLREVAVRMAVFRTRSNHANDPIPRAHRHGRDPD